MATRRPCEASAGPLYWGGVPRTVAYPSPYGGGLVLHAFDTHLVSSRQAKGFWLGLVILFGFPDGFLTLPALF